MKFAVTIKSSELTYLRDRYGLAIFAPSCLFEKLWDLRRLPTSLRTASGQQVFSR